jgi:hypothetical protein
MTVLVTGAAIAASATTMRAPAKAKLGAQIKITAAGLKPGHYTLELAIEAFPGGASPTNCVGKVGAATAHAGRLTITGNLPTRLACYQGVGAVEGYETAKPGTYDLTLGVRFHPNGFSPNASFIIRKIRLTG